MGYTFYFKNPISSFSIVFSYVDGNYSAELPVSIWIPVLEASTFKKELFFQHKLLVMKLHSDASI